MNSEEEERFQQIMAQLFGENALQDKDKNISHSNNDKPQSANSLEEGEMEVATKMAEYELDQLRKAFINFQKEIRDLVLLKYSTQFLLDYSSYCEELENLLLNWDGSKDEEFIVEDDLRNQILTDIYEKYIEQMDNEDDN
ncbi:hypothetical protein [Selenihalanaerobacter shriftii]|uniref:Uncharacterized protein n=1 Tax=Selenihalanaerobacter shriftii TaxID=142842 RepID=A0A1T4QGF2_9FIRM|nr:hypothetical protein [Selenihalanaerobacter shriftii]SKA02805.1 hypothetical protein SAMN02745118_02555 [Selenihalanaerobacter shriftii]